jgi:predicted RecB family nuclease
MSMKITFAAIEGYLQCPLKGYLKLCGEAGAASEFEQMLLEQRGDIRLDLTDDLLSKHSSECVDRCAQLDVALLKRRKRLILDAVMDDETFLLRFDGLLRVDGSSELGRFHYVPLVILESRTIKKCHRTLLALHALVIGRLQGRRPAFGFICNGKACQLQKVRLDRHIEVAERIMGLIEHMASGDAKP